MRIRKHMPQRTSKILLVRLTANENALLFQITSVQRLNYSPFSHPLFQIGISHQETIGFPS